MRQSLLWSHFCESRDWRLAEWAAGGGKDETLYLATVTSAQTLVDGVMLAVNGQQRDSMPGDSGHDDFSGGNENFFIGERDALPVLNCLVSGWQADDADGGGDYGVRIRDAWRHSRFPGRQK